MIDMVWSYSDKRETNFLPLISAVFWHNTNSQNIVLCALYCKGVFYYSSDKGHHEDYKEKHEHHGGQSGACPSGLKGNECAHYQDGYKAGKQDGKASMSRACQRHSDAYDSRFQEYFKKGYKASESHFS